MSIQLFDYQLKAIEQMKNGCILCGGVGSGKSLTSLSYYYLQHGGNEEFLNGSEYFYAMTKPKDLYIITTARKRDTCEWEAELAPFLLTPHEEVAYYHNHKVVIDSWNNIKKYKDVYGAFFIFDEQRVVGSGAWVKAFLNIARKNNWILLSATPGDTWSDYIPVFVANGFYKNKTEFINRHVIYSRYTKFPKIDRYIDTGILMQYRNDILVDMDFQRKTVSHHEDVFVGYDIYTYKDLGRTRWNPYLDKPIENVAELCYTWRKIVNSDEDRQLALLKIFENHQKLIVFYNFDYELDILKKLYYGEDVTVAEWNGHKHEPIPKTESWVYLVQYTAGCEGWNCILTDALVFYSQNYSYHLKSRAPIDMAISRALKAKKNFSERRYMGKFA